MFLELGEELALGLGQKIYLHADPREHARDDLTNLLVIDITVVRAIELDIEALRIAGFRKQCLRRFGIIR